MPALGSWLYSIKVSGASEDLSENATNSLDPDVQRDNSATWVRLLLQATPLPYR